VCCSMMSYIVLKGCWCYSIVPSAHAPTEDAVFTQMTPFVAISQCVHPIICVKCHAKIFIRCHYKCIKCVFSEQEFGEKRSHDSAVAKNNSATSRDEA
jgi:hypothetical protein